MGLHCERILSTAVPVDVPVDASGAASVESPASAAGRGAGPGGAGDGGTVVLLHGFGQTARCWGAAGVALAASYEVWSVDAPGHGGSAAVRAGLEEGADLVADLVTTLVGPGGAAAWPVTLVGYSMGARLALHVALRRPEVLARLVLIGGTAGIEDEVEREERRERDLGNAARMRAEGVESFFADWFDQPLFASLPAEARFLGERRRNTAEGLASSLELAGTGSQRPLWSDLAGLAVPVLAMAGAWDERYVALAERMATAVGRNGQAMSIAQAGHAAHLERPEAFVAGLRSWIE